LGELFKKMNLKQKDIVLLHFPFAHLKASKIRPAVVVSNNDLNNKGRDCLFIPLTSVPKKEPYSLQINQEDLSAGKLYFTSRARADKITAIERSLVIEKIGILNEDTMNQVKSKIISLF
jgi:mRNA interferase MazF